ncbi:MAG: 4Fe-4S binding protein [Actinobacteria bacterium]|nr:4Fe-4S binding protein [Actinomycetota bacterium]
MGHKNIRNPVQIGFLIFNIYTGWRFYLFVNYFSPSRPPSAEAYLPISALISAKYLFLTGIFDKIHPAGLSLFLIIIFTSWLFKRGFCSWICPIGTLSEWLFKAGKKIFGRNFKITKFIDVSLRSLKYLLLLFFFYAVFSMDEFILKEFINSPYNRVADVKMLKFFTDISLDAFIVILILMLLSLLFKNFWCRYLCPYGALLGIVSMASPLKISRDSDVCTECGKCTKVCPSYIDVQAKERVLSEECIGCFDCVVSCPAKGALELKLTGNRKVVSLKTYAVILLTVFFMLIGLAQITNHWNTSISVNEYKERIQDIDNPVYSHPGG